MDYPDVSGFIAQMPEIPEYLGPKHLVKQKVPHWWTKMFLDGEVSEYFEWRR